MKIGSLNDLKFSVVHFIGIGGISMSALAQMLLRNKIEVQGSDLSENEEVILLKKKGIKVFKTHSVENLKGVNVVVYSSAIHEDNEELVFARQNNMLVLKRAQLLGIIASSYKNVIAIAGSHGKTTTTAMVAEMLIRAGKKPTVHIGGMDNLIDSNYKIGGKKFFVTEACEYMDNYLYLSPDISVVLNIDSDHLDYFKTIDRVKNSFLNFALKTKKSGVVFYNLDDANSEILQSCDNITTFGISSKKAEIQARKIVEYEPSKYKFDVYFCGVKLGNIKLNIFGKHNIYNALVVNLIGLCYDIDFDVIKRSIESFSGVSRRTQMLGKFNGGLVFHDYAHHPKQIEMMIKVARELTKKSGGRVVTIFEPHTYSRTKFLLDDFARSFMGSDIAIFAPVYSAREDESQGKNSLELAEATKKFVSDIKYFLSYDEIFDYIKSNIKSDDVLMILGAGSIENLAIKVKNELINNMD